MEHLWKEIQQSWPLIAEGGSDVHSAFWNTIRVAIYTTAAALVIGLPPALALAIGRFRGRRLLQAVATASLGLPSVVVGVVVFQVLYYPLSGTRWLFTMRAVYLAQTVLALPYIVALVPAAIQELEPELLAQARLLGARRVQLAGLVLREARVGVLAAVIAALGSGLAEVGAVTIVGGCAGTSTGGDTTLGCLILPAVKDGASGGIPGALACGQVLLGLMLLVTAALTIVQQRGHRGGGRRATRTRFGTF